jgi:polyphosphate kinase 2 (PPK2 family)
VVALTRPTETERGQWYFHRYVAQLPTAGEIVLFDRSPMDIESLDRWDAYTTAKEAMIEHTDTAPWTSIKGNDKKRARINAMRFLLNQFAYEDTSARVRSGSASTTPSW